MPRNKKSQSRDAQGDPVRGTLCGGNFNSAQLLKFTRMEVTIVPGREV